VATYLDGSTDPDFSITTYEGIVAPWYMISSTPTASTVTGDSSTENAGTAVRGNFGWALTGPLFMVVVTGWNRYGVCSWDYFEL